MNCDALFKGTSVDGVYDADPKQVPGARRYETVSYSKVLADNLKVMDASAVSMCRDNDIPIIVFNIREPGALLAVLNGEGISTTVTGDANG
jgi:uridylate kinase